MPSEACCVTVTRTTAKRSTKKETAGPLALWRTNSGSGREVVIFYFAPRFFMSTVIEVEGLLNKARLVRRQLAEWLGSRVGVKKTLEEGDQRWSEMEKIRSEWREREGEVGAERGAKRETLVQDRNRKGRETGRSEGENGEKEGERRREEWLLKEEMRGKRGRLLIDCLLTERLQYILGNHYITRQ